MKEDTPLEMLVQVAYFGLAPRACGSLHINGFKAKHDHIAVLI